MRRRLGVMMMMMLEMVGWIGNGCDGGGNRSGDWSGDGSRDGNRSLSCGRFAM